MDYVREGERERAKKIFRSLTNDKRPSVKILYEHIEKFLFTIIQDDLCLTHSPHGNHLHDLLCQFSFAYIATPLKNQLDHHGALVNGKSVLAKGSNGRVYDSGKFEGNPIVTKTKKKVTEHTIYEVFLHFVVLNKYLLEGIMDNVVPSYGLFVCGSNSDGTEVCAVGSNVLPGEHLFLVQQKINGVTLLKHLEKNISVDAFQTLTKKVFEVVGIFEASEYQLYHMDLHAGNIMIVENRPVLIDFELACWTLVDSDGKKHRYRLNSEENKYSGSETILTGAYDAVIYFSSCLHTTKNKEIQDYCLKKLEAIFTFQSSSNKGFIVSPELVKVHSNRWLYRLLKNAEDKLSGNELKKVREHNLAQLRYWTIQRIQELL